ncbi:sporulation histidine kinase inhibitor Sda [Bacillus marinisedimentorum]|nr:sporulation histidine kinase inhibitor Sda [Bacillus marinisedimentorum]
MDWKELLDAYKIALEFNLSEEFIELLRDEIDNRNLTDSK